MGATARKFATRQEAFAFVLKSGPTPEAKAVAKKWFIDIDDLGWASLKEEPPSFSPEIQPSVEPPRAEPSAAESVRTGGLKIRRLPQLTIAGSKTSSQMAQPSEPGLGDKLDAALAKQAPRLQDEAETAEPKAVVGELIAPKASESGFFGETKFEEMPEEETLILDNIPYDNAQKLLSLRAWDKAEGVPTLRYCQKSFWSWQGTHWQEIDEDTSRAAIWNHLNRAQRYVKAGKLARFEPKVSDVNAVLDALQAVVNLEGKANPMPGWFGDGRPAGDLRELVALENGLLHFGTRTLLPHTPKFWSPNVLPYGFDSQARAPRFEQFLEEVWPGDPEAQGSLLEMFGLLMTDITEYQKMFMFVGPKRGGRGTIGRLLKGLIGPENYVGTSLKSFSEQFGMENFVGKKAAVFSDVRMDGISRAHMTTLVERLLSISGEDDVPVNRKYHKYWSGQLLTRLVFFANELPRFHDDSGALSGRFLSFQMQQTFYGREDPDLTKKLLAERPGILNLALDALARLRRRGRLVQCASGLGMSERLDDLTSDVGLFVKECCVVESGAEVLADKLFMRFQGWCEKEGIRYSIASQHLSEKIRAAVPTVRDTRSRKDGQGRPTSCLASGCASLSRSWIG
jgi:putative DNA primase/helicase